MGLGLSVVIPSWNGLHLLRENLPSVERAARCYHDASGGETEIIVVDDGSQDETVRVLAKEFPSVRRVAKERNEGFARACNAGFETCRQPLVALLNNDVHIQEDYLVHKGPHFEDPNVFAVTAKVFAWDAPLFTTGGRFGRFRRGFWAVYFNYDAPGPLAAGWIEGRRLLSFYAIGGFATYDRRKLEELGGFNPLLSPFHWEDVDLSYRGWKRGWEVRYEPRSVARHRISATIDSHFRKTEVETASMRNRLLFHWINIHSPGFLLRHLLGVGLLFLTRAFVLDADFYRAFFQALEQLGPALKMRRQERSEARRSDADVARRLGAFYRLAPIEIYYNKSDVAASHPECVQVSP